MEKVLERLFILTVGLFWASIFSILPLIRLLVVGPRKLLGRKDVKNPPEELFNPEYGEHAYINLGSRLGSVRLHCVISGPKGAPLMLMLHGFPEIWYSWRYQIKEFKKDFRVVAVDMRGFGDSDKPLDVKSYKMDVLVEDVRTLIGALGYSSCVLVSHDWGGGVAYAFAAVYPTMVDRLVVMNIPPVAVWREGLSSWSKPLQFISSGYIYFFHLPYIPEFHLSLEDFRFLQRAFLDQPMGVQSGRMTEEDVDCYKYYMRLKGSLTSGINYYRANLHVNPASHRLEYPMPVQIIWGCKDRAVTLTLLEDTVKVIPHAEVVRIEEASHWVQMDQPEKVNAAIREFLAKTKYTARTVE